jgi:hypothetical protein
MKEKITNVLHALYNPRFVPGNISGAVAIAYCFNLFYPLSSNKISCISDPMGDNHAAYWWCFLFGWVYMAQLQMVEKITFNYFTRVLLPQILVFFVGLYVCGYPIF